MGKKLFIGMTALSVLVFFCVSRGLMSGSQKEYAYFSQEDLFKVMDLTGVDHGDGSIEVIVKNTQAQWLRKPGQERWQMEAKFEDLRANLIPVLKVMGLVDEMVPFKKSYTYLLFLGASLKGMECRLKTLRKVLEEGVQIGTIVVLVGQRMLEVEEKVEARHRWGVEVTTETDLARCMIGKEQFGDTPILIIDAPQRKNEKGIFVRPTTEDTIREWLKSSPEPGTVLAISSQPVCLYQKMVLTTALPETFEVEMVGAQVNKDTLIVVYLDTIARTLYQFQRSLKL